MQDANNELFETRQLQAHLEEFRRLAGETHAVFQRQQQIINVMVLLASGISAAFIRATHNTPFLTSPHWQYLVLVPRPFLVLASLHLRDDLKVHTIDEYVWLVLRPKVMKITGAKDEELWNFLRIADRFKFGRDLPIRILGFGYIVLSGVRYGIAILVIFGSLGMYFFSSYHSGWSKCVFCVNLFIALTFFILGGIVVKKSGRFIKETKAAWITSRPLLKADETNVGST